MERSIVYLCKQSMPTHRDSIHPLKTTEYHRSAPSDIQKKTKTANVRFTQKTSSQTDGGQKCFFSQLHSNAPLGVLGSFKQKMPKSVLFPSESSGRRLLSQMSTASSTHTAFLLIHPPEHTRRRPSVRLTSLPAGPERFCFSSRPRGAAPLMHNLMSEKCLYEQMLNV